MARDAHYPSEELEWLASTAFNRAVDFYLAGQDADCKCWVDRALELAALLAGNGRGSQGGRSLLDVLREKYEGLVWEDEA